MTTGLTAGTVSLSFVLSKTFHTSLLLALDHSGLCSFLPHELNHDVDYEGLMYSSRWVSVDE